LRMVPPLWFEKPNAEGEQKFYGATIAPADAASGVPARSRIFPVYQEETAQARIFLHARISCEPRTRTSDRGRREDRRPHLPAPRLIAERKLVVGPQHHHLRQLYRSGRDDEGICPQWDPKRRVVAEQLKRIGVWPSADLRPPAFSLDRLDIAAAHTFENNKRRHTAEGRHASNAVHVARAGPQ
jgi:hypothetical protein